jgi:hypothetical protein
MADAVGMDADDDIEPPLRRGPADLMRSLPRSAGCAALHSSKLVFASPFSLSFLLAKITGRFTSHGLCGRPELFLGASTTEKAAD